MSYCDYLAHLIRTSLITSDRLNEDLIAEVNEIVFDIDENGSFLSTKKTLDLTDIAGHKYTITIEEAK